MLRRTACARAGAAAAAAAEGSHGYSARAQRIRRQELFFRQLRRLIIPGFLAYGMFVARPQEGHFLRYLAERRHHDVEFNRLFPPLPAEAPGKREGDVACRGAAGGRWAGWLRRRTSDCGGGGGATDDEARLARRRLLFSRERAYSSPDGGEVFRPIDAVQRAEELALRREHPPMHLLSAQLQELMKASKAYAATGAAQGSDVMPVRLEFHDWIFFATAGVVFADGTGASVRRLRFLGLCGMMWWEL
ncbi:uncharacterized protein Tco025E_03257 [Trypanosoma conorhini]|uniref:Uncharacterized protein n=1 Tax=Trypanosoma conorhini TaxID=83891 RepID=A0A3R7PMU5_9TRYP|nr:uncharacterized protein Tco025E_03257 [Trypanosoma conorhini]RNF22367.1 hypothetical protein Tco025E_03257 [Trypanosoma conorhini]